MNPINAYIQRLATSKEDMKAITVLSEDIFKAGWAVVAQQIEAMIVAALSSEASSESKVGAVKALQEVKSIPDTLLKGREQLIELINKNREIQDKRERYFDD